MGDHVTMEAAARSKRRSSGLPASATPAAEEVRLPASTMLYFVREREIDSAVEEAVALLPEDTPTRFHLQQCDAHAESELSKCRCRVVQAKVRGRSLRLLQAVGVSLTTDEQLLAESDARSLDGVLHGNTCEVTLLRPSEQATIIDDDKRDGKVQELLT